MESTSSDDLYFVDNTRIYFACQEEVGLAPRDGISF